MSIPSWTRSLRWTLVAGVLVGLGVGAYRLTPPAPLCAINAQMKHDAGYVIHGRLIIDGPWEMASIGLDCRDEDGAVSRQTIVFGVMNSLQVWDVRTGARSSVFLEGKNYGLGKFSKNKRFFAAESHAKNAVKELALVDLVAGKVVKTPVNDAGAELVFSKDGNLLARTSGPGRCPGSGVNRLSVYESSTGRLLTQRASQALLWTPFFEDDRVAHWDSSAAKKGDQPDLTPGEVHTIEIYNPCDGNSIAKLEGVEWCERSRGQNYAIAQRAIPGEKSKAEWLIWNLRTHQIDGVFQVAEKESSWLSDSRHIVLYSRKTGRLAVRDVSSGRHVSEISLDPDFFTPRLSPDGDYLAVIEDRLKVFKMPGLELLWEQTELHSSGDLYFGAGNIVVHQNPTTLNVYDLQTGERRKTIAVNGIPYVTADRQTLLVRYLNEQQPLAAPFWAPLAKWAPWLDGLQERKNDGVIVLDAATLRERFRLTGANASSAILSDDGQTLVTAHSEPGESDHVRCWDVNAWKPLHYAIGVPAGLGGLIVLFSWWRDRRSRAAPAAN